MKIELNWISLIPLKSGKRDNLIYKLENLESIPKKPGIYVFGRRKGKIFIPIYIGQSAKIRSRIRTQFNNVMLMMGLKKGPGNQRFLSIGLYKGAPGQNPGKVLNIVERALIKFALAEGYDILNKQGIKRREHRITSNGSRKSNRWFPREMFVEKGK